MRYYIIAGEASGDLHGSNLMKGLYQADPEAEIRFWGGEMMAEQGGTLVKHYKETAFIGFLEVLTHLKSVLGNFKRCREDLLNFNPDVLILIDYPGFNLRMARFAKEKGIRVFYYIAPKVWAWKESRVHKLRAYVDQLFIIFPFEVEYFRKWNVPAYFAGNPLIDSVNNFLVSRTDVDAFKRENGLDQRPLISILAGSRLGEISYILPRVSFLASQYPQYQFVVAGAPSLDWSDYQKYMSPELKWVKNKTMELMSHSQAAVVASGTATLEAALLGVPQVVCYGGSEISYQIAKRLIKGVKYISLVNLILDRECVRELIQHDMNPALIQNELESLLPGGKRREKMMEEYDQLREILGGEGASLRVAREMVRQLKDSDHV